MRLHSGTLLDRIPGPKYVKALHFAELAFPSPLPRPGTLARLRSELPDDFLLAIRAPKESWLSDAGAMRFDDSLEKGLDWLGEAIDRLRTRLVVIQTGSELTPGQRDRDALRGYFERLPHRDELALVWQPSGLWEPPVAQHVARKLGAIVAIDGLEDPVPQGPLAYVSLSAQGARQSFSHHDLAETLRKVQDGGVSEAFITIDSGQSFREATLLQTIAAEA